MSAAPVSLPAQSAPTYVFSHLAGPLGGTGDADGTGQAARFDGPLGLAVDNAGNILVADTNNGAIRMITPSGAVTTIAGNASRPGCAIGPLATPRFAHAVAVDSWGNTYVAETYSDVITKITPAGDVSTLAGTAYAEGSVDGTGSEARFYWPSGISVDGAGNVYVADTCNHTIRKITPAGVVTTLAGTPGAYGTADGMGAAARFTYPYGIATDASANIYVADRYDCAIRRITPAGVVTTLAGTPGVRGAADGIGAAAQFDSPWGIAVDRAGNVLVADYWNNAIRQITPDGAVTTLAGEAGQEGAADGIGAAAQFNHPVGVAVDGAGAVFVADSGSSTIRRIGPGGVVTTLAGRAFVRGSADGIGTAAQFDLPDGVAVDRGGRLFVADSHNYSIRMITPAGAVATLGSAAGDYRTADGTATLVNWPRGVAVDRAGKLHVVETGDSRISRITPEGERTLLRIPPAGLSGSTARTCFLDGVAVDDSGNVFLTDASIVRKVTPGGDITTLAGSQEEWGSADGIGSAAQFGSLAGLALDRAGNVYVADDAFNTIRKITPGGVVTTLAGTPDFTGGSADGRGAAARFRGPTGVAIDEAGNVFVADSGNNTIRLITPDGVVTTVAGRPDVRGSEDGVGAAAQFNCPAFLAIDSAGNLYVCDYGNNAIRKGQLVGPPVITAQPQSQTVRAGGRAQFSVAAGSLVPLTYQWYFNGAALGGATDSSLSLDGVAVVNAGSYTVVVANSVGQVRSNQATLAVSSAAVPASSGSDGAGSIEGWFALALLAVSAARWKSKRIAG